MNDSYNKIECVISLTQKTHVVHRWQTKSAQKIQIRTTGCRARLRIMHRGMYVFFQKWQQVYLYSLFLCVLWLFVLFFETRVLFLSLSVSLSPPFPPAIHLTVCVCVCVGVCMTVFLLMQFSVCVYFYVCARVRTRVFACVCACVYVYVYVRACIDVCRDLL